MALAANSALNDWDGTGSQTILTSSSDLANAAFSPLSDELDNSTTKATAVKLTFVAGDGFTNSGSWSGSPVMNVYMVEQDIDGNDDEATPDASNLLHYADSFTMYKHSTTTTKQQVSRIVSMFGIKKCKFILENQTGRPLEGDGGTKYKLYAELLSLVPKAS